MDMNEQAIALTANYAAVAFALLTKCLQNNGALAEGQFEGELRATIEHPEADVRRLDYRFLTQLLDLLEGRTPPLHS